MNLDDNQDMSRHAELEHIENIDLFYDVESSLEVIKEIRKHIKEESFLENYALMFSYVALYHLEDFNLFSAKFSKMKREIDLCIELKSKEK